MVALGSILAPQPGRFLNSVPFGFYADFITQAQLMETLGFPGGSDGKESACNAGGPGSLPGLGRSPGEGQDNPLQYSCLENSMDRRRAWRIIVHGVTNSPTWLND